MKATIIFAHPWHGSFNKSILDTVVNSYKQKNREYQIIDLNKDNFNPILSEGELALYSKGQYKDDYVKKYQDMLRESDELVFIFPIWWYSLPSILKGFIDKVMLKDFSYKIGQYGILKGQLTYIKKTIVITTSESPNFYLKYIMGNPIKKVFIKGILKDIGLKNIKWFNNERTTTGSRESKKNFLTKIAKYI